MGQHMTAVVDQVLSLKNRFSQVNTDGLPIAEFNNKAEFSNMKLSLTRKSIGFSVRSKKKTKTHSAKWTIILKNVKDLEQTDGY